MKSTDFVVIGGGIIGLSIARSLKRRFADCSVTVLEKEPRCGLHASGRNSGVLHAGFYYSPDSLKAKLTRFGNRQLTELCESYRLPLRPCGKLVVAQGPEDHPAMDELLRRGQRNGILLEDISENDARKIEPRVKTCGRALFSPTTATVDPLAILDTILRLAQEEGVKVSLGVPYLHRQGETMVTGGGLLPAGYIVNAAGLYADRIAREFGFSQRYRILPFKGLYLLSEEPPGSFRTNVYPVPHLGNPFLGVHVTVTVDGRAKVGPTAIPALWREQYEGWEHFDFGEFLDSLVRQLGLLVFAGFDFKRLAFQELKKYSRSHLIRLASSLVRDIRSDQFLRWGRPGIRAQLVDMPARKLEMDFILEGDDRSMHVLNAVSPGLTCALPFADYIVQRIADRVESHGSAPAG